MRCFPHHGVVPWLAMAIAPPDALGACRFCTRIRGRCSRPASRGPTPGCLAMFPRKDFPMGPPATLWSTYDLGRRRRENQPPAGSLGVGLLGLVTLLFPDLPNNDACVRFRPVLTEAARLCRRRIERTGGRTVPLSPRPRRRLDQSLRSRRLPGAGNPTPAWRRRSSPGS